MIVVHYTNDLVFGGEREIKKSSFIFASFKFNDAFVLRG